MKREFVTLKVDNDVLDRIRNDYESFLCPNNGEYIEFFARTPNFVVTAYKSNTPNSFKVTFIGEDALNAAKVYDENASVIEEKPKAITFWIDTNTQLGSDEVGTGDYFVPIVVSATYVSKENIPFLIDLGVRDSKKLTDEKMIEIAPKIIEKIPYVTFILDNSSYNKLSDTDKNMNKIKAVLHNKVLVNLIKQGPFDYEKIVIDQFVYPKKFYEHISRAPEKITNVTFLTKAEDQVMSVAAASIISRYVFLREMKKMGEKFGKAVPLGASNVVDDFACEMVKKYGMDVLTSCTKLNFKNTEKVKNLLS